MEWVGGPSGCLAGFVHFMRRLAPKVPREITDATRSGARQLSFRLYLSVQQRGLSDAMMRIKPGGVGGEMWDDGPSPATYLSHMHPFPPMGDPAATRSLPVPHAPLFNGVGGGGGGGGGGGEGAGAEDGGSEGLVPRFRGVSLLSPPFLFRTRPTGHCLLAPVSQPLPSTYALPTWLMHHREHQW
jgi:hypothetical protein